MLCHRFFACLFLLALSAGSFAARPNFNYLGAGYAWQQVEGEDFNLRDCDADGLYLEGSITLNEIVYFHGQHADITSNNWCGSTSTALSLGIRGDLSPSAAFYGMATMINRDYGRDSDAGFGAALGARGFVSPGLEARGFVAYEAIDDMRQTIFGGGVNYWFSRAFSLTGELAVSDEENQSINLGLRFNFY